jgi:hypothetical protein
MMRERDRLAAQREARRARRESAETDLLSRAAVLFPSGITVRDSEKQS